MKFIFTKTNAAIVVSLVLLLVFFSYSASLLVKKHSGPAANVFACGNQQVPFRANISRCMAFNVKPDNDSLSEVLASPVTENIALLVSPNSTGRVGLAAIDIYKIYKAIEPKTNIGVGIAYTEHWPEQPLIKNITIDDATFANPIIWLRYNQAENSIVVDGPRVYVNTVSFDDLDAAACRIAITAAKKALGC